MPTPFDVYQIPYTASSKLVARLCLPDGTSTSEGTTLAGGLVNGGEAVAVPTGSFYVYLALIESPSGYYGALGEIAGTALPDTTNRPYTVEVRVVDGGTDMTSYSSIATAFIASDTIAYTRDIPATLAGGYLQSGVWKHSATTAAELAAAVAGRVPFNVISPATPQHLDVYRGDYYDGADGTGRTLSFTYQTGEAWPDELLTAHFSCAPTQATTDQDADALGLTDVAMDVDTATGDDRQVTLTLTATQLGTLTPLAKGTNGYRFWIIANKGTRPATLRSGTMTVRPNPTA